jgi:hypothetical protein
MSATYKYIVDIFAKTSQFVSSMNQSIQKVGELDKKVNSVNSAADKAMGSMVRFAAAAGIAFSVKQASDLVLELAKMGGQAEGVRSAFQKIGSSKDLEKLRDLVHGTVGDLELMKRAVTANNYGIPVKELGNLFAFATKRAQDTGQSVDYLVDSIVTGIGRKSPLILDNLGISATQLKEKLGGVAMETASVGEITKAVGEIAQDSFKKTGEIIDTNAIKLQSLSAQWENTKLAIAESPGFQKSVSANIDDLSDTLEVFFSDNLTKWQKFMAVMDLTGQQFEYLADKSRETTKIQKDAAAAIAEYDKMVQMGKNMGVIAEETAEKTVTANKYAANSIGAIGEELKALSEQLANTNANDIRSIQIIGAKIVALEKYRDAIKNISSDPTSFRSDSFSSIGPRSGKVRVSGSEDTSKWSKQLMDMSEMLENNRKKVAKWKDELVQASWTISDAFGQGFAMIGESVIGGLGLAASGLEGFLGGLAETVVQLISMAMSAALAAAIQGATISAAFTGPGAIFAQPAFIATAIGGVMAAFAAIPKFETGGIIPGSSMYGDKMMVRVNSGEEVLTRNDPRHRLNSQSGFYGGGGSAQTVILQPSLAMRGDSLRVMLKRVDNNARKRT